MLASVMSMQAWPRRSAYAFVVFTVAALDLRITKLTMENYSGGVKSLREGYKFKLRKNMGLLF